MRKAESIRRRINEIKEVSVSNNEKALCMLAEVSFDIGIDACEERAKLREEIEQLRRFIIGNGDPTNSIMSRLKKLEECVNNLSDKIGSDISEIKLALLGDMTGEKKGLYDRVNDNTRITKNLNRITWAVVLVILGEITARILGLF